MEHELENGIASRTHLSQVDGKAGKLTLAGYAMEDLARHATFEEVAHLLLLGRVANARELDDFSLMLASRRGLPPITMDVLRDAARRRVAPMDALRMAAPLLSLGRKEDAFEDSLLAIASFPAIIGAYARMRSGLEPVPVLPQLSHAAHYLYQLSGEIPSAERVRAMETYLITVCDHGFNASTFAARVIVSTGSDVISAVTGALGALKGPLHGGAPGPALDMVFEIGSAERAEPVLRAKLARGERLMGFGHRIYQVRDPRADILGSALARFYANGADQEFYDLARSVELTALRLLKEWKPDRRLETNVEFYTALLLHGLGLAGEFFTPTFAVGRVLGWTAHCLEQIRDGRLIRPQSEYIGPTGLTYVRPQEKVLR